MSVDIEACKVAAKKKLEEQEFKAQVNVEIEKIKARRKHLLPWRIKFRKPWSKHCWLTGKEI
jgi:hypothetical protein